MKTKIIITGLFLFFFRKTTFAQIDVQLQSVASGYNRPVAISNANDDRLFIVEQDGKIKIIHTSVSNGSISYSQNNTPFLDITAKVGSSGNEQGLLGLAFDPNFSTNHRFYVNYTNSSGNTTISRFVVSTSNPDEANPNSEEILLIINQPFSNHNGGTINFGPDGYLYIGTGDVGSGGDPNNNAQNGNSLLGKLLRIDVSGASGHTIPPDNPYINNTNYLNEIWALGLRNPWKFSFDKQTGDLWIGDVGQNTMEEIDKITSTDAGTNFGWRCYEGTEPYNTSGCNSMASYTAPVAAYYQGGSPYKCAITGGYVYRGTFQNSYIGKYFFTDFCGGTISVVDPNNGYQITEITNTNKNISTFGESNIGELYVADLYSGTIFWLYDSVAAINENTLTNNIHIYPNPVKKGSDFSIKTDENITITKLEIYFLFGKLIKKVSFKNSNNTINTKGFKEGVYFLKIFSKTNKIITKKLVIQ